MCRVEDCTELCLSGTIMCRATSDLPLAEQAKGGGMQHGESSERERRED